MVSSCSRATLCGCAYADSGVGELLVVVLGSLVVLVVVVVVANVMKSSLSSFQVVASAASCDHLGSVVNCGRLRRNALMVSSHLVQGRAWRLVVRRLSVY